MATSLEIIKKYLPESLRQNAARFTISEEFLKTKTNLVILVLQSRSMDTEQEKQSWFNLMPMMTEEQIAKLNDILTREKIKLAEIEKKYEEKKRNIKEKYIKRRETMWYNKKMESLHTKESAHREEDLEEAEDLLEQI